MWVKVLGAGGERGSTPIKAYRFKSWVWETAKKAKNLSPRERRDNFVSLYRAYNGQRVAESNYIPGKYRGWVHWIWAKTWVGALNLLFESGAEYLAQRVGVLEKTTKNPRAKQLLNLCQSILADLGYELRESAQPEKMWKAYRYTIAMKPDPIWSYSDVMATSILFLKLHGLVSSPNVFLPPGFSVSETRENIDATLPAALGYWIMLIIQGGVTEKNQLKTEMAEQLEASYKTQIPSAHRIIDQYYAVFMKNPDNKTLYQNCIRQLQEKGYYLSFQSTVDALKAALIFEHPVVVSVWKDGQPVKGLFEVIAGDGLLRRLLDLLASEKIEVNPGAFVAKVLENRPHILGKAYTVLNMWKNKQLFDEEYYPYSMLRGQKYEPLGRVDSTSSFIAYKPPHTLTKLVEIHTLSTLEETDPERRLTQFARLVEGQMDDIENGVTFMRRMQMQGDYEYQPGMKFIEERQEDFKPSIYSLLLNQ